MAKWFVHTHSGDQEGPYTSTEMRGLVAEGKIGLTTPIRREGQQDWVTARSVKNLFRTTCILRAKRSGGTAADEAPDPPPAAPAEDLADPDALLAEDAAETLTDEQSEVMAALDELDTGTEEDWDAFFNEQGQQLRGPEEAASASVRELRWDAKKGRVKPAPMGPVHRRPKGAGDDEPAADEATPSAVGAAVAIIDSAKGQGDGPQGEPPLPGGPSTMEHIAVGVPRSSTNPLVVVIIVIVALAILGSVAWLLGSAFSR